jgi:aspartate-semialdehyde dehydrogenase
VIILSIRAGLVGVGPVGDRIVRCLKERNFPLVERLKVAATRARIETLGDEKFNIFPLDPSNYEKSLQFFDDLDIVFFAGREGAKGASVVWAKQAIKKYGCFCIDNGADYRLDSEVPLVIPEVNIEKVTSDTKLIASPNCSTTQMVVALWPLHKAAGIKRIVVSTYQSTSGWGGAAQKQLKNQIKQLATYGKVKDFNPSIFPRPIALDCIPHIDRFFPDGYTKEEWKMLKESQKIMDLPNLKVSATAVRVPVEIGHSMSINVEFENHLDANKARQILSDHNISPGVVVVDGLTNDHNAISMRNAPEELQYPTQADALQNKWKDMVLVGRIRNDNTIENGLNLWCVSDNLRKGAATNVVQIAEKMFERKIIG